MSDQRPPRRPFRLPVCYLVCAPEPLAAFEELHQEEMRVRRLFGTEAVIVARIGVNPASVFYANAKAVGAVPCLIVAHDALLARQLFAQEEGGGV